jgi:hypothetical protein
MKLSQHKLVFKRSFSGQHVRYITTGSTRCKGFGWRGKVLHHPYWETGPDKNHLGASWNDDIEWIILVARKGTTLTNYYLAEDGEVERTETIMFGVRTQKEKDLYKLRQ